MVRFCGGRYQAFSTTVLRRVPREALARRGVELLIVLTSSVRCAPSRMLINTNVSVSSRRKHLLRGKCVAQCVCVSDLKIITFSVDVLVAVILINLLYILPTRRLGVELLPVVSYLLSLLSYILVLYR